MYYSLIQYMPNRSRMEGRNVGLLLWDAKLNKIVYCKVLNPKDFLQDNIHHRLLSEKFSDTSDLEHFIRTRGNSIILTPLRYCNETDYEKMFKELVE